VSWFNDFISRLSSENKPLPKVGQLYRSSDAGLTDADLGMFSMFGRAGAAEKGGPTGRRMLDSSATFSGLWGLFMACCDQGRSQEFDLGGYKC